MFYCRADCISTRGTLKAGFPSDGFYKQRRTENATQSRRALSYVMRWREVFSSTGQTTNKPVVTQQCEDIYLCNNAVCCKKCKNVCLKEETMCFMAYQVFGRSGRRGGLHT
jgi:hypothetical protein